MRASSRKVRMFIVVSTGSSYVVIVELCELCGWASQSSTQLWATGGFRMNRIIESPPVVSVCVVSSILSICDLLGSARADAKVRESAGAREPFGPYRLARLTRSIRSSFRCTAVQ